MSASPSSANLSSAALAASDPSARRSSGGSATEHGDAFAVIDIGTTSLRMAIAERDETGGVRTIDALSQGVSLGKDTFTKGGIQKETIEECARVLRLYRDKLEEYGITRPDQIRVVATSAVREAANQLAFIDRIYVATGLTVEPLDEAEVHRITYRSIQPLLAAEPAFAQASTIICEVGGGSTELLIVERGSVRYSHSYRLGSLRLPQTLQVLRAPQEKMREMMELEIERTLETLPQHLSADGEVRLLALGGDIRFAAGRLIPHWKSGTLGTIPVDRLALLCEEILLMTEDSVSRRYHLTLPEAETLGPALLVYLELARLLGLEEINVSGANLRDGLLREMVDPSIWTEDFRNQIIRSAVELGRKYQFDEPHARHVAHLSGKLFDALQDEHGLDARLGLVLQLAALLYEIGRFVGNTSMHKHSMYLIQNSDLFGLSGDDVMLVALVARYHRRASPKPTHPGFSNLDRDRRVAVAKLAALLRIAIALDASRNQRVRDIQCSMQKSTLVITVPDVDDLAVEQLALRQGGSLLFEEIFGKQVLLRSMARSQFRAQTTQL